MVAVSADRHTLVDPLVWAIRMIGHPLDRIVGAHPFPARFKVMRDLNGGTNRVT